MFPDDLLHGKRNKLNTGLSAIHTMDFHTSLFKRLKFDPGLGVVILLTIFATWPLLRRPGLPTFTDADHHVYRTLEIILAWQQGVPYLRWAPDLFLGYGYPIFNYYTPLTYYIGAAYGALCCGAASGATAGVKFVFVAAATLGMAGMYLFVRDRWNGMAGVVGAAAYGLSPYLVYVDPHARGASPETFAIALAPWLWWSFGRLLTPASPGDVAFAVLIFAALLLTHNLMSFVFIGLLGAWLAWEIIGEAVWGHGGERAGQVAALRQTTRMIVIAGVMGMGLSAFMWLPAWLERGAVQFSKAFVVPSYGLRFVGAQELFAPASLTDVAQEYQQGLRFRLGLPQWILGALGGLTLLHKVPQRKTTLFFAFLSAACLFCLMPISAPLWKEPSPLLFLQLPWRLLGPGLLGVGVLAGATTHWASALPWRGSQAVFGLMAITFCLAGAFPVLDPPPWTDVGPISPQRLFVLEESGVWGTGTTQQAEFLPVGAAPVVSPQESLIRSYDAGLVDKVDRGALPAGTQIAVLEHGPEHDRFQVTGQADFTLRVFTFYFPGWTAYVDGAKTPIQIDSPGGWITFTVPAGGHEVWLRFENTWPRWLGWAVSGLTALGLIGVAWQQSRSRLRRPMRERLTWRCALLLAMVVLAGIGLRRLADRSSWWRVHSGRYEAPGAQVQRFVRLENNIALLAFDLPRMQARPGEEVPVILYWQALDPVSENLSVFVHLLGPNGRLWGQSDALNPADFPTTRWLFDRLMRDEHVAALQPDAPPGMYTVRAGLWDRYAGVRMHVLDENGQIIDQDGVVLTTDFVVQP